MTEKIKEALTEHFGERCADFEPECPCCQAWAELQELMDAPLLQSRRASPSGVEVKGLVDYLWQELCELPDRTSPDEYPDMAMATLPEITAIVETFFERQALTPPHSITHEGGEPVAWECVDAEGNVHLTRSKAEADGWDRSDVFVRPLYTSPSLNGVTVSEEMVERLTDELVKRQVFAPGATDTQIGKMRPLYIQDARAALLAALEGGSQT